ncbi:MAG: N-acyl homoserine lactonase family protein [Armatimonadota bacterium]|nr:N-acyl homoserine lactonase family protein [Armatimonadota bacterium]MDR7486129.1 N-acyl homoserine lactonase family protein [Armatimonadota bacterium]MDR7531760.1 N-acyl homoserine lactonase family protein [Armatimonadota bacterium]MDR7534895.1 N-acyl homoserine lactonase family protein [Armatimonadota bacterium]
MGAWRVFALSSGGRTVDWSTRLYLHPVGETMTSAYFLWVLHGEGEPVVVDTGFTARLGRLKGVPTEQLRPREQLLAAVGVQPERVRTVVLTHLHWDHFDLEGAFPTATFWVQRREVEFWAGYGAGEPWHQRFLSDRFAEELQELQEGGRLKIMEGALEPTPGVRLEWVGGHSPGMQIVVVETAKGPFVIANDALTTYRNLRDWVPPAIHLGSVAECLDAMRRIRALCDGDEDRLCPGHDGEVWRRFPEVAPGVFQLA